MGRRCKKFAPLTDAERAIFEANTGLIGFVLGRYLRRRPWLQGLRDDLESEGSFALMRAVRQFDPKVGVQFSTYACVCIWRGMHRVKWAEEKHQRNRIGPLTNIGGQVVDLVDIVATPYKPERTNITIDWGVLNARETDVLKKRLAGVKLEDLAAELGLCKERVRQIQNQAGLRALRIEGRRIKPTDA